MMVAFIMTEIIAEIRAERDRRDGIEQAISALMHAKAAFDHYAEHHRNKTPPDGEKTRVNEALSAECSDAIRALKDDI